VFGRRAGANLRLAAELGPFAGIAPCAWDSLAGAICSTSGSALRVRRLTGFIGAGRASEETGYLSYPDRRGINGRAARERAMPASIGSRGWS